MKLATLLVCLLLQLVFHIKPLRVKCNWLDGYAKRMKPLLTKINAHRSHLALIGLLIPLMLLVIFLNSLFSSLTLLYFIYSIVILMLCLDATDLRKRLNLYFESVDSENLLRAQVEAEQFVGHTVHQDKAEMTRAVTEAIFTRSVNTVFAIIFWFMLLGPFGALLYYFTLIIVERSQHPQFGYPDTYLPASYLKEMLDWLPVRLVTLTFALISQFRPVFDLWLDRIGGGLLENRPMLIDCGLAAIDNPATTIATSAENQQALNLVSRTLWTWVIIAGIFTIIGLI